MSYVENTDKKIRMHTIKFQSDEYKCIPPSAMQVMLRPKFTSLWYLYPAYNLPVLGNGPKLQFNKMRSICV
jgi:hypothetical protein